MRGNPKNFAITMSLNRETIEAIQIAPNDYFTFLIAKIQMFLEIEHYACMI